MTTTRRQRLRFDGLDYEVFPDGRCTVEVRLEWRGVIHRAKVEGMQPMGGNLRAAAQATLAAATQVSGGSLELTLTGIKPVRAFDELVIIAGVKARAADRSYRLLGAKATTKGEREPLESTARSVLDAINRVLELYVVTDDDGSAGDVTP